METELEHHIFVEKLGDLTIQERDKVTGPLITCFTPPVSGTVITNFANTNFNTGTVEQSNSGKRVESGQSSSRGSNKQNKQTNSSANYCDRDK